MPHATVLVWPLPSIQSAIFNTIPKPELRDPQAKDLCHGELVLPPGELATT